MTDNIDRETMLEMFIFETFQLLNDLEQSLLESEKKSDFDSSINEIFRIMHTIKGSSAMMLVENISSLTHSIEDLFFYLRDQKPKNYNLTDIIDIVLDGIDFIKEETSKLENNSKADGDASGLIKKIKDQLKNIKNMNAGNKLEKDFASSEKGNKSVAEDMDFGLGGTNQIPQDYKYEAILKFEDDCGMENIRAFSVIHDLEEIAKVESYYPKNVMDNDADCDAIRKDGFRIIFSTSLGLNEVKDRLSHTILLKNLEVCVVSDDLISAREYSKICSASQESGGHATKKIKEPVSTGNVQENVCSGIHGKVHGKSQKKEQARGKKDECISVRQSVISVNISKLDELMDMVGELVIAEAMVTKSPDLAGLQLRDFNKSAMHLNKITGELQDIVMSIRMVPLSMTFQKMKRIVRDMGKKLNKSVELEIIGEETEVDKNIIERISDPLIHLIRNSIDHGIEEVEERKAKGKPPVGKLVLEAKNAGGDVWVIVRDDGRGLKKERILKKAQKNGLIYKPEDELTDSEIYSFIFMPGFSTNEGVTEFSGRGVGMDIVTKNISMVGGTISVDSMPERGTTFVIRFPLTLAIINGMAVGVGESRFTIPTISIKESFRISNEMIIEDNKGNETIMVRGEAYPILRLHRFYNINTKVTDLKEGIAVMVENDSRVLCLFADQLLGEQQVVVKALPKYIKKVKGIGGCTLLADGSISLILNIADMINMKEAL
ncbi:MAG: chemotaxis protein CheA [Clostridium sp.]|nr:chemotaxis protein CheA [Clostridium sp.]